MSYITKFATISKSLFETEKRFIEFRIYTKEMDETLHRI